MRNRLLWVASTISLLLVCLVAATLLIGPSDEQLRALGYYRFDTPRVIQDFSLLNHESKVVDKTTLMHGWSLLFFGFTSCPDACPTTLAVLDDAVSNLQDPPRVILVSVDPERDRPAYLARYVKSFNSEFSGFTGTVEDIAGLATQLHIAFGKAPGPEPGTYTVDHSVSIVVIDPQGRYAGFFKAPHQASNIVSILKTL